MSLMLSGLRKCENTETRKRTIVKAIKVTKRSLGARRLVAQ